MLTMFKLMKLGFEVARPSEPSYIFGEDSSLIWRDLNVFRIDEWKIN